MSRLGSWKKSDWSSREVLSEASKSRAEVAGEVEHSFAAEKTRAIERTAFP